MDASPDDSQKASFDLDITLPGESMLLLARESAASPNEDLRAVAKAVLDVTAEGAKVQQGFETGGSVDLAPYFDFWFADAITAAERLLHADNEAARSLARCLIDQERAILRSKEGFLEEMKRRGIQPSGD